MKARVEKIQGTPKQQSSISFDALDQLIRDIASAKASGTNPEWIAQAQLWQRKAQFLQDYTVSENSKGFHAPQYSLSLVNQVTDAARRGQLALRGISEPITWDPKTYTPILGTPAPAPATTPGQTPAPAPTPTPIVNPPYSPMAVPGPSAAPTK